MKHFLSAVCLLFALSASAQTADCYDGTVISEEGAWCWFADPRAMHYKNEVGTIDMTWVGYIDVHGNIKATQYDWLLHRKTDVLVRSYFQPDDHNNPTFLVLPDERVLVIYSRHTDEAAFYYRISRNPGDITDLGEEKRLATNHNTTYPSPFILSDDPTHWYLCWRGINWHPTIARLTLPDANDNVMFDFGPKQIVQSTGARPYAKYQSNGKDKIYLTYTTGHPDNEYPNWLYFNVIDINHGNGPILRDIKGTELKKIADGAFNVNKTDTYASTYPFTVVDKSDGIRNWVWQITLDPEENPVIAFTHIDNAKTSHVYWYGRWTGTEWRRTWVQYGGHAFHQNWNSTELCYSGGMAVDPEHINDLYLSIPTTNGTYNKDGVYEIWKYTIDDEGKVAGSEQITRNSLKNNVRPFIIPGSEGSDLRLAWMNGDYYYWIVKTQYPKGFPTSIRGDFEWDEELTEEDPDTEVPTCICFGPDQSLHVAFAMNASQYDGTLLQVGDERAGGHGMRYSIDATDQCPVVTIGGIQYKSQNRLLTSDDWATMSSGTSGDNHPTKLITWVLSLTYDGHTLTTYRNGFVDQVIEPAEPFGGHYEFFGQWPSAEGHALIAYADIYVCQSPYTVQASVKELQAEAERALDEAAINAIVIPTEARTDIVLPTEVLGKNVTWASSDETLISPMGIVNLPKSVTEVTLTALCGDKTRDFTVTVHPRDITQNLRYEKGDMDLTSNTLTGFSTNTYYTAPEGLLTDLRSFTFLVTVNAKSLEKMPRLYDFGSASGNSVFLRANPLAAGVKYNGGTTTMVSSPTQLTANQEYKLAVTFEASTRTTRIYIDGIEVVSGTANQVEAYQLAQIAADTRNYIGRTQWWDTNVANDNADFCGMMDQFRLYDIALTRREICEVQGLPYEQRPLPTALQNGDFEQSYSVMSGSGVSSDRAIYVPQSWTVEYADRNNNDLTALKTGDLYFSNFFASRPSPSTDSKQTYWVRQNWGTSTITLSQEVRLPEGDYELTADVWKSGLGGDAIISVASENGITLTAPSLENKEEWQQVLIPFSSDGDASTTVLLSAMHNNNGYEKIIGFDNVVLTLQMPDAIEPLSHDKDSADPTVFDLTGRVVKSPAKGIFIVGGKKVVK
ncbi:MAG: BNR-4 repeat-containing protein [Bacteroidaceae bacterium]|nr:BNR-4 repeat-containing protein [Bacteroidaceae bacterium]